MTGSCECYGGTDAHGLVRVGADRAHRSPAVLDPAAVPVDERGLAHDIVFAAEFASHLRYFTPSGDLDGDWRPFFDSANPARIASAAIADVDEYRRMLHARFRLLENPDPTPAAADDERMAAALRDVFDAVGSLSARLDALRRQLPPEHSLSLVVANLIRTQLAAMLRRLIGCYRAGVALGLIDPEVLPSAEVVAPGGTSGGAGGFARLLVEQPLSGEWPAAVGVDTWAQFAGVDPVDFEPLYGTGAGVSERINHLATHNLFRAASDAFLAAFARVVEESGTALEASLAEGDTEPHYALFLAFLRLLGYSRDAVNTFTRRHLEFYYRDVLRLTERPAQPSHAHALVHLAKHVDVHLVPEGTLIKAGKDKEGADAHFRVDRDLVANEASLVRAARLFRNPAEVPAKTDQGRLYADVVAADAESWHPFADKAYRDGAVQSIRMEPARVGFAIASHHLWMAEGDRTITLGLTPAAGSAAPPPTLRLVCRLTGPEGMFDVEGVYRVDGTGPSLTITLTAGDPPVVPYDASVHGSDFATALPMLIVLLEHTEAAWDYAALEGVTVSGIRVAVSVKGVRTLELSNDHGPVDASKPFLAFGSTPRAGSSLVVGSKEIFQKQPSEVRLVAHYPFTPMAHMPAKAPTAPDFSAFAPMILWSVAIKASTTSQPDVVLEQLSKGKWIAPTSASVPDAAEGDIVYRAGLAKGAAEPPDLTANEPYTTASRSGFLRLRLESGYGTDTYPLSLAQWTVEPGADGPPLPPVLPTIDALTAEYDAVTTLSSDESGGQGESGGRFFHITPFGHAEQRTGTDAATPLVPRFLSGTQASEGELYLGLDALRPPQDVSLLFQVVDGTADPQTAKPAPHIVWSYLRGNEWQTLPENAIADATEGLLVSGIVKVSVPADASVDHTILPGTLRWLRLSVSERTDAVCRLAAIRTQALRATSVGDPEALAAGAQPAGTLTKLDVPDAAVKSIEQPYPTFGGRARESAGAFRTRVSERLRHKDRAIALWDYEHLILERFPSIFQARCLDHTRYEPGPTGTGIYSELAAGHVTIVTIPDLAVPDQRDPLRPFTSLGVLTEVERFLAERMSCFARLHVRNPQFEEVVVDLRVRLRPGRDETFHLELLRREIVEFLSPWAFRGPARPTFHGRVRKSVLIDFIEERPYVDYLTDVKLFRVVPGQQGSGPDLDDVSGSRSISILVSAPAAQHGIRPIHEHTAGAAPAGCGCGSGSAKGGAS
jgi:hypothetical protein